MKFLTTTSLGVATKLEPRFASDHSLAVQRVMATDSQGLFEFIDLRPGVYEIAYRIVYCQTSLPRSWRECPTTIAAPT